MCYTNSMRYSKQQKQRVLEYLTEGHTQDEAKVAFRVARSTINRWKAQLTKTGSLENIVAKRKGWVYDVDRLAEYVEAHPQAYLYEIAQHFGGSVSGVLYALKREGITLKKR